MPTLQCSLLDQGTAALTDLDPTVRRLADDAWIEHQSAWLQGSDDLFDEVERWGTWDTYAMPMYGRMVRSPRLTSNIAVDVLPPNLDILRKAAETLGARHGVRYRSVGCNLYRDGTDSVAWHGDKESGMVAIISLGARRPFRLRPVGGGPALSWALGRGDLMVMGGTCQHTWQHTVPKAAGVGPRISVTFRTDEPL